MFLVLKASLLLIPSWIDSILHPFGWVQIAEVMFLRSLL